MKFLADENFDGRIVRGLLRRRPSLDLEWAVDAGLLGVTDPTILEYAANEGRAILTNDVATMLGYVFDRVELGLAMPGLIEVPTCLAIGAVLDDLILLIDASLPGEWEGRVIFLPL